MGRAGWLVRGNLEVLYRKFEKVIEDILDNLFEEESYEKERGRSALEQDKL